MQTSGAPLGRWTEVTNPDELLQRTRHFYDFILKECKFDSAQYSDAHGTELTDVSKNHVRLLLQRGTLALELSAQGAHHLQLAPEPGEVWDELELLPKPEKPDDGLYWDPQDRLDRSRSQGDFQHRMSASALARGSGLVRFEGALQRRYRSRLVLLRPPFGLS